MHRYRRVFTIDLDGGIDEHLALWNELALSVNGWSPSMPMTHLFLAANTSQIKNLR
jgi:hypothetical protein